jgi:SPP1 family predicted phage head-tail adaptor
MDPRRRNTLVTLKSPPTGRDAQGQPSGDYVSEATVWANIRHLRGVEAIKAGAEISAVQASINIGFRSDVNAGWQVVFGPYTYEIKAVLPDLVKKSGVDLACELVR